MAEDAARVTVGEVFRSLEVFRGDTQKAFDRIDARLDGLSVVSQEVHQSDIRDVRRRIGDLESAKTWLVRTIIGTLAVQGMAVVMWFAGRGPA